MISIRLMTMFIILGLTACSLGETASSDPTPPPVNDATPTPEGDVIPPPAQPGLTLTPAEMTPDGTTQLQPGQSVNVAWVGAPANAMIEFILLNQLIDGGAISLGVVTEYDATSGPAISFTVPQSVDGQIYATARLPGQTGEIVESERRTVITPQQVSGPCQYQPAALGPGETRYAEPDINSAALGRVDYDTTYDVLGTTQGPGRDGVMVEFYELGSTPGESSGWVVAGVGRLIGECAA